MAISAVTANANTVAGSSSITSPTGTQAGDVLVCIVAEKASADGVTKIADTATGTLTFTSLAWIAHSASVSGVSVWYRVVQAGDPTAWTITTAGSTTESALMAYRGVDNTTPIDANGTGNNASSTSPGTFNAVTTVTANAWYVGAMSVEISAAPLGSLTSGSPTPTIRANAGNGGNTSTKQACALIDVAIASASTSNSFSYTLTTANYWSSYSFALRPAIIITDPFPAAYNYPDQLQQNAVYRM